MAHDFKPLKLPACTTTTGEAIPGGVHYVHRHAVHALSPGNLHNTFSHVHAPGVVMGVALTTSEVAKLLGWDEEVVPVGDEMHTVEAP